MTYESRAKTYGGTAVLLAMIAGVAGLILALASVEGGHFEAAAISLIASAVAFGSVANAIFRH